MFSNIDFLSGEVKWMDDYLQEDMLLVEYPNNFLLDLGWYAGTFIIHIVKDNDWRVPVVKYTIKEESKIQEALMQAIERVEKESKKFKPFYGDLWKTENIQID